MIVLDTHIWIWWVTQNKNIKAAQLKAIDEASHLGISAISVWEVAKLAELKRLVLAMDILEWIQTALSYPKIQLIPLTPEIIVESSRLPGNFHKDPADQLIVATSKILNCPLITSDAKILNYSHVNTL
jgi:PIN domain nuclease of toxin-antitoxin system